MIYKAASNGTHTLFIEHDDDPPNPREDYDNFGKMICFHKRYSLGDKHNYCEPRDFLADLLNDPRYAKQVYDYIKKGEANGIKLEYDRSEREWQLLSYWDYGKKWYVEASFPPGFRRGNLPSDFLDAALEALPNSAMLEIINDSIGMVILPLFLYDHSVQSISTGSFLGRAQHAEWDSGQVGWVYADQAMIEIEYGEVTAETIEKATALLQAEVKCYDLYLTGQCYGFRLFEGEEETDSCWGFLGDIDDLAEDLRGHLPEACRHLVDELNDCRENTVAEYFWRRKHAG